MEIQQIKQRLKIETVLARYQLTPDRNNRLRCPFHDDKTPSMQVYPKTGTWTCFSSTANPKVKLEFGVVIMQHGGRTVLCIIHVRFYTTGVSTDGPQ
ncbi:MAG: CHC2 zinc finger domain-containing protein, partial [Bacteroidota bacterium]